MHGALSGLWTRPGIVVVVMALGVFGSFALDWRQTGNNMQSVARERGAALFRLVELTRDWNARHGGVYVPVTEATAANPYLKHERRELVTRDGLTLTMINPAYMTRQIAEIAQQAEGFQLHITSLKPIRPANAADPWEAAALARFEEGLAEVIELVPGPLPVHRYMAPLKVTKPCLKCHEEQGYTLGQVRGGISVTMPAAPLLEIRDTDRMRSGAMHLLMFAIVAALLHILAARTRKHVQALEMLAADQEQLIGERTRALSAVNDDLKRELANRDLVAAVFENAVEAIVVTNERGEFVQVNPAFSAITGFEPDDVLGRSVATLDHGRHAPELYAEVADALVRDGRWQGEIVTRRKGGQAVALWLSVSRIAGGDQPVRCVATLTDITWRKEMEEELRHRAYHDPLTNLPNRALFLDRLSLAVLQAQRHGRTFALCFIDLDYFKPVNDKYGHSAGDELLIETALRLVQSVRAVDTVARLGGDEFAAILTEAGSRSEVEEIAARIVGELARPFALTAGQVTISCSMGVAIYPQHGKDVEALQHQADSALYQVKESSRNGFRICSDSPA